MESRPRLKIELTQKDRIWELSGWLGIALLWASALFSYGRFPDQVPVHFSLSGQVDKWGDKSTTFLLPAIGTLIYSVLTWINRYPHLFNYPVRVTRENALIQYTRGTRLIRYLKTAMVFLFILIFAFFIRAAGGRSVSSGAWILPVAILAFLVFFIWNFASWYSRDKKRQ
jgi:hypothetical protein